MLRVLQQEQLVTVAVIGQLLGRDSLQTGFAMRTLLRIASTDAMCRNERPHTGSASYLKGGLTRRGAEGRVAAGGSTLAALSLKRQMKF